MPATSQSIGRTRGLARFIGPFLATMPAIVIARATDLNAILKDFFANPALVFITAAAMLIAGLAIIAHHQYWSSAASVIISLLGWYLALRALALLVAPRLYQAASAAATATATMMPAVWLGCGVLTMIGIWLTHVGWIARPGVEP